jgi:cobalt-zinc-cadmium resistance protein CzcA
VIGGVVTSTILTLIVLPILYTLFGKKKPETTDGITTVPLMRGGSFTNH